MTSALAIAGPEQRDVRQRGYRFPCQAALAPRPGVALEARAERRFGDFFVPSSITVGRWFDTPRYAPFFMADIRELTPIT